MSDDEYYYDSPYEDLTDILWDTDPSPDLADELAEHAMYSPIWQDNPVEELKDYHSDWEYYSDEYYDDDPQAAQGKTDRHRTRIHQSSLSEKRGKKRKIVEVRDGPPLDMNEADSLAECLRGTVWSTPEAQKIKTYRLGQQPTVALNLSNKVMHAAYNRKRGFGQARLARDESWANDLSLADMGLNTELSMGRQEGNDVADAEQEEAVDPTGIEDDASTAPRPSGELTAHRVTTRDREYEDAPLKKKRRRSDEGEEKSQPALPELDLPPAVGESHVAAQSAKSKREEPNRVLQRSSDVDGTDAMVHRATNGVYAKGRKRKSSAESTGTTTTACTRVKRVVSDSDGTALVKGDQYAEKKRKFR